MLVDLTPRAIPVPLPGKLRAAEELHERKPSLAGELRARPAEAQGTSPSMRAQGMARRLHLLGGHGSSMRAAAFLQEALMAQALAHGMGEACTKPVPASRMVPAFEMVPASWAGSPRAPLCTPYPASLALMPLGSGRALVQRAPSLPGRTWLPGVFRLWTLRVLASARHHGWVTNPSLGQTARGCRAGLCPPCRR